MLFLGGKTPSWSFSDARRSRFLRELGSEALSGNVCEEKIARVVRIGGVVFAQIMIGRDVVAALEEMVSRGSCASAQRACIGQSIGRQARMDTRAGEFCLAGVQRRRGDFFGQVVEHDLVEMPHRPKSKMAEVRPQAF